MDLSVSLGRLHLKNPVMVASGTFGYAREMQEIVDVSRLGAVLPKTITAEPRIGNRRGQGKSADGNQKDDKLQCHFRHGWLSQGKSGDDAG